MRSTLNSTPYRLSLDSIAVQARLQQGGFSMQFRNILCIILAVASLLQVGCQGLSPLTGLRLSVDMEEPFVIVKSTKNEWGFASHVWACSSSNGIMLDYSVDGDPQGAPVPDDLVGMSPAFSRDGGQTWIFGEEARNEYSKGKCFGIPLANGDYAGVPWTRAGGVTRFVVSRGQGFQLPDGSIIMCGYGFLPGDEKKKNADVIVAIRSIDNGVSYSLYSVIATSDDVPPPGDVPTEPAMIRCRNGDILCVMRVGGGGGSGLDRQSNMLMARSHDDGRTWDVNPITVGGVMPKLYELSNGIIALVFGRPGNNIIFSSNYGRSWGGEVTLSSPGIKTSGYADVVEVEPGRLLAVYDTFGRPEQNFWLFSRPPGLNIVWGRFINISKRF